MSYSEQDIIENVTGSIKDPSTLYKQNFINYSLLKRNEVVAEELIKNDIVHIIGNVRENERVSGYHVKTHNGTATTNNTFETSNRKEEHFALGLYRLSKWDGVAFNEIGMVVDYQVPLKNTKADLGKGKIDLISMTNEAVWLLELKVENSKETVLKCVLEIVTYYQILAKKKFLESYVELSRFSINHIKKGILIHKGSRQEQELIEMKAGKRPYLKKVVELLGVEAFVLEKDDDQRIIISNNDI